MRGIPNDDTISAGWDNGTEGASTDAYTVQSVRGFTGPKVPSNRGGDFGRMDVRTWKVGCKTFVAAFGDYGETCGSQSP